MREVCTCRRMCVCMYVCMYVCMNVCMWVRVNVHKERGLCVGGGAYMWEEGLT